MNKIHIKRIMKLADVIEHDKLDHPFAMVPCENCFIGHVHKLFPRLCTGHSTSSEDVQNVLGLDYETKEKLCFDWHDEKETDRKHAAKVLRHLAATGTVATKRPRDGWKVPA